MRAIIRRADSVCLLQFAGDSATVLQIKQAVAEDSGVPVELQRLVDGAHELADGALVSAAANTTRPRELECVVRTSGGKGGFGAMLRSARGGLDAKKTTNFDAMRDLSGRRSAAFSKPALQLTWQVSHTIWCSVCQNAPRQQREEAQGVDRHSARARSRRQTVHIPRQILLHSLPSPVPPSQPLHCCCVLLGSGKKSGCSCSSHFPSYCLNHPSAQPPSSHSCGLPAQQGSAREEAPRGRAHPN